MMLEVSLKIVCRILFARLEPVSESLPQESQCGFRSERGSNDGIFNLRSAIKKRAEHGLESWIFFLDLVKAFDTVPRKMLWAVLRKLGVNPHIVDLLDTLTIRRVARYVVLC